MEHKNTVLTILLVILISLAIFAVIKLNNKTSNNKDIINTYNEDNQNKVKVEETEEEFPKCIASFTTNITYPDESRTHNITTCCKYLNSVVIKSGETFSFNETLGPFNEEQGYTESTGFDSNGKIIKIIGGGICQVSSTLYNTALMANLVIVERNEHSAPVDYVAQGKDATICYPYVDLKFKNNLSSDITVKAVCDGKQVTVELETKNK